MGKLTGEVGENLPTQFSLVVNQGVGGGGILVGEIVGMVFFVKEGGVNVLNGISIIRLNKSEKNISHFIYNFRIMSQGPIGS